MKHFYYFFLLALVVLNSSCQHMTEYRVIKSFGVDIFGMQYSVIEKNEEWLPNGDGKYVVRLSFENSSIDNTNLIKAQMLKNGANSLPIKTPSDAILETIKKYEDKSCKGLYILEIDNADNRNYRALVFDEKERELIVEMSVY